MRGSTAITLRLLAAACLCIAGCHDADFKEAVRQPIGTHPNRPLLGAWEGPGSGPFGPARVRMVLYGRTFSPCPCGLGTTDYWVYLILNEGRGDERTHFILRAGGRAGGRAALTGRALAPTFRDAAAYDVTAVYDGKMLRLCYYNTGNRCMYEMRLHRAFPPRVST